MNAHHQTTENHPFEPFLPDGARILFLGSFPPQPHRWCMPFYYPNWINDFWRIMGLIHFGDKEHFYIPGEKRFDEQAIRQFCTDAGLAFYDTACEVRRLKDNASDAFLEVVTPTDIPALLARIPECHTLVTTGEKASTIVSQTFHAPIPPVGGYIDIVMPVSDSSVIPGAAQSVIPGAAQSVMPGAHSVISSDSSVISSEVEKSPRPLRFYRMPSTSRAYPLPLEKKAEAYRQLF